jgi:AcrR family transcriptional regulator
MPRPAGARNRDYEQTRHALAASLTERLLRDDGTPATFADLAVAAGVSTTTLKHYFGDRDGLYAAVLDAVRREAGEHIAEASAPLGRLPEQSLPELLLGTAEAWRHYGLGRVFTGALALGLGSAARGPSFLDGLLEPVLQAAESLLLAHEEGGELRSTSPDHRRAAAITLMAPLVLALLHQDNLGGHTVRPLDVDAYLREHAALVLAGLRATT